jgi:lia operon protein LiaG
MVERTRLMRIVIVTSVVSVASLGIAAGIAASGGILTGTQGSGVAKGSTSAPPAPVVGGYAVDERRTLSASGAELISIETVSDSVKIVEAQGDSIQVRLYGTARSADTVPRLVAERRGSTADVHLEYPHKVFWDFHWNRLVLEVSVPRGYGGKLSAKSVSASIEVPDHAYSELTLSTTSGSIRVASVSADNFSANTKSGSIYVASAIADDFSASSTSGSVRAESIQAKRSDVSSVSGSVHIGSLTGDLTARSVSGSIRVACKKTPGRLDAKSTSGSIVVRLPPDASFTLDAHSISGTINCGFPISITEDLRGGGNHVLKGTVGSGNGSLLMRTTSGSIKLGP